MAIIIIKYKSSDLFAFKLEYQSNDTDDKRKKTELEFEMSIEIATK